MFTGIEWCDPYPFVTWLDQIAMFEPLATDILMGLTHEGDDNPHMADGNLGHGNLFYVDKPGVQVPRARK